MHPGEGQDMGAARLSEGLLPSGRQMEGVSPEEGLGQPPRGGRKGFKGLREPRQKDSPPTQPFILPADPFHSPGGDSNPGRLFAPPLLVC